MRCEPEAPAQAAAKRDVRSGAETRVTGSICLTGLPPAPGHEKEQVLTGAHSHLAQRSWRSSARGDLDSATSTFLHFLEFLPLRGHSSGQRMGKGFLGCEGHPSVGVVKHQSTPHHLGTHPPPFNQANLHPVSMFGQRFLQRSLAPRQEPIVHVPELEGSLSTSYIRG